MGRGDDQDITPAPRRNPLARAIKEEKPASAATVNGLSRDLIASLEDLDANPSFSHLMNVLSSYTPKTDSKDRYLHFLFKVPGEETAFSEDEIQDTWQFTEEFTDEQKQILEDDGVMNEIFQELDERGDLEGSSALRPFAVYSDDYLVAVRILLTSWIQRDERVPPQSKHTRAFSSASLQFDDLVHAANLLQEMEENLPDVISSLYLDEEEEDSHNDLFLERSLHALQKALAREISIFAKKQ